MLQGEERVLPGLVLELIAESLEGPRTLLEPILPGALVQVLGRLILGGLHLPQRLLGEFFVTFGEFFPGLQEAGIIGVLAGGFLVVKRRFIEILGKKANCRHLIDGFLVGAAIENGTRGRTQVLLEDLAPCL